MTRWDGMYSVLENETFDQWAARMVALDEADYQLLRGYNGPPTERPLNSYDLEQDEPPTLPPSSASTIRALPPTVAPKRAA